MNNWLIASENRLWSLHFPPVVGKRGDHSSRTAWLTVGREGTQTPAHCRRARPSPVLWAHPPELLRLLRACGCASRRGPHQRLPPRRRDLIEERSSSAATSCRRSPSTKLQDGSSARSTTMRSTLCSGTAPTGSRSRTRSTGATSSSMGAAHPDPPRLSPRPDALDGAQCCHIQPQAISLQNVSQGAPDAFCPFTQDLLADL